MKLRISKRRMICWIVAFSYIMTIIHTLLNTVTARYAMYAMIILVAIFVSMGTKKYGSKKLISKFPILWAYFILTEMITLVVSIGAGMNPGTFIQPVFMISCVIIGYRIASCGGVFQVYQ